jgi:hypothetical protein
MMRRIVPVRSLSPSGSPLVKKLSLRTERLNELTTDDLHHVAGAQAATYQALCLSLVYGGCQSVQQACTTAISCGCQPTWNCA